MWVSNANSPPLPEVAASARADDVANISGQTNGVKSPNLFAGFTDPGLTISTVGGVQFASRATAGVLLETTYSTLDAEISGYLEGNILALRVTNGGAIVLFYPYGGILSLGYYSSGFNLSASSQPSLTYVRAIDLASLPGWPGFHRSTDVWTLGAVGIEVYVKYNGVEVARYNEHRWMHPGTAAVWKGPDRDGTSNVTVKYFTNLFTYSNRAKQFYDIRDFGASQFNTTGSMTAGSPTLTVADASGISVGQQVIVETSGEPGLGMPGTMGVGGAWPRKNYATTADITAVTTTPEIPHCWDRSTGLVWLWDTGLNSYKLNAQRLDGEVGIASHDFLEWYTWKSAPRALVAKVIAKSGTTLTLDTNAQSNTTGAGVFIDCSPAFAIWKEKFDQYDRPEIEGVTLLVPPGRWALGSEVVNAQLYRSGWTIRGVRGRKADTVLFAPKGAPNISVRSSFNRYSSYMDITIEGNHKPNASNQNRPKYYQIAAGSDDYPLLTFSATVGANNTVGSIVKDCAVIDVMAKAVAFQLGDRCQATDVELTMNARIMAYTQWYYSATNGDECTFTRCTVPYSAGIIKAYETFYATRHKFIDCGGMNCMLSTNQSSQWVFDGFYSDLMPNSFSFWRSGYWGESVLGMSNFIYDYQISSNGIMRNFRVTEHGYCNENNDNWRLMQVTHTTMQNTLIENGLLEGMPYAAIDPTYRMPGTGFTSSDGLVGYINSPTATMRNVTIKPRAPLPGSPSFLIETSAAGCTFDDNILEEITFNSFPGSFARNVNNTGGSVKYAPNKLTAPAAAGTPTVGSTLTAVAGTYFSNPSPTFIYHWLSDGGWNGFTGANYTVRSGDVGHVISVQEFASNGIGSGAVSVSAPTAVVT